MSEMSSIMGPIFWLIIFFAALALAAVAERLFYFHRVNINSGDFLRGLSALLRSGAYDEALHEARRLPGPMARVVESVLPHNRLERAELREIAMEAAELEVYRIERNIRTLVACAVAMPLLGILGTLLTLVRFYEQPGVIDGSAALPAVAATVQQALLLSATGVALAIPTYLFYTYLSARARKIVNNVERAGLECVHIICDLREAAAASEPKQPRACCCAAREPEENSEPA
ncbi:MAG: MotA/TolQ/ExbB proton channel family protein [Akkermansia sp.]